VIEDLRPNHPDHVVAVVLLQLVEACWWEWLLRTMLLRNGGPALAILGVP
jgi:hypothetical protein